MGIRGASQQPVVASSPAVRRCLLVEDNPVFAEQIQQAMCNPAAPWQVRWCRCGAEALAVLEELRAEAPLDLALVDLGLPDLNGVEVVREVHRRSPDTPVMVASMLSAESSVLEAIRAGARGYVLKEEPLSQVTRAIEQILQGEYPISPRLARMLFKLAGAPAAADTGKLPADTPSGLVLSPRETQALRLISRGFSYKEVAAAMEVTLSTVQTYIRNLYRKLDVHSQVQAVNKAKDQGLL